LATAQHHLPLECVAEPAACHFGAAYEHVRGRVDAEFSTSERALKKITYGVHVYAVLIEGDVLRARLTLRPSDFERLASPSSCFSVRQISAANTNRTTSSMA